jgi:hypothetical protein
VVSCTSGREIRVHSAWGALKAVILLCISAVCCFTAFPQNAQFLRVETLSFHHPPLGIPALPCAEATEGVVSEAKTNWDSKAAVPEPAVCGPSSPVISPLEPVQPCMPSSVGARGCPPLRDLVQENLNAEGKTGQKISQSRERVLEILQSENDCTRWYQTRDADPAATFRTLSFELDKKGDAYILGIGAPGDLAMHHNPYVARVVQGNGSYATITLNAHGAFFAPKASLQQASTEGGPIEFRGFRPLQVGPYAGSTMPAQVLTLLHEFGHLLDLLPIDEGDRDGKSVQNTMEVLKYCRAEIESSGKHKILLSAR